MESGAAVACVSLLLLSSIVGSHAGAGKEGYQTFVVGERSRSSTVEAVGEQEEDGSTWSAEILHRDSLLGKGLDSKESGATAFERRMARDAARVEAIGRKLEMAMAGAKDAEMRPTKSSSDEAVSVEEISSPIVSGIRQGSGEYFTRFGIGTPAKQSYFVLDTGSDVSWTQCAPCRRCYKQSDPLFDPSLSSTFKPVGCGTALCGQLQLTACRRRQCLYQVSYGDGSFTVGTFAQETFTFSGGQTAKGVAIGCGHDNEGLFVGASGLLGLGGGKLSFPSQIRSDFSYCLADRFTGGSSALLFGPRAAPAGSAFTPLVQNPKLSTFYYVSLQGISVGGHALRLSSSAFSLASSGTGGVILDSGTSVTRLVPQAYAALRDAFRAGTRDLAQAAAVSLFDTCYDFGGAQSVDVPTVDLHFAGGATMLLPASNYLVPVDTVGTYCFGFAPSNAELSIIGNMQQQGFRIAFSTRSGRVGLSPNRC